MLHDTSSAVEAKLARDKLSSLDELLNFLSERQLLNEETSHGTPLTLTRPSRLDSYLRSTRR